MLNCPNGLAPKNGQCSDFQCYDSSSCNNQGICNNEKKCDCTGGFSGFDCSVDPAGEMLFVELKLYHLSNSRSTMIDLCLYSI